MAALTEDNVAASARRKPLYERCNNYVFTVMQGRPRLNVVRRGVLSLAPTRSLSNWSGECSRVRHVYVVAEFPIRVRLGSTKCDARDLQERTPLMCDRCGNN